MALDRTVSVKLKAEVAGYMAAIRQAGAATTSFANKVSTGAVKNKAHLDKVGGALLGIGAVAGLGVAAAVKSFADFDHSMSAVAAATHESATNMNLLRDAAIEAGAKTVFSATEAAGAEEALAKAGVDTADILGGALNGSLALASAGTLAVGDAAEIAATAMTQFGLSGKDVPHIADLLAAGAGKAQGEVSDLGVALKYVGPVAHQMGISIEETTGVIAELASNGILADQAGTSLRGMLSSLTSPSQEAAQAMKTYSINVYDAAGNFVGFDGVAGQLHDRLGKLDNATRDAAFGQIFGNQQVTAARVLYAGGAKDVEDWTKKVNDAGYAQETAATKLNNLQGDMEQLRGSLSTLFIETGQGSDGFLRGATQGLTNLVNGLGDLPKPAHQAILGIGGVVTGASLLVGGGIKAVQALSGMKNAMENLKLSARGLGGALGIAGLALTVGVGLVSAFASAHAKAKQAVDGLASAVENDGHKIGEATRKAAGDALQMSGALDAAALVGVNGQTAVNAYLGQADAIKIVADATAGWTDEQYRAAEQESQGAKGGTALQEAMFLLRHETNAGIPITAKAVAKDKQLADAVGDMGGAHSDAAPKIGKTADQLEAERQAFIKTNPLAKSAADVTKEFAQRQDDAAKKVKDHADNLDRLLTNLGLLNDTAIDATKAQLDFLDAISRTKQEIKDEGKSLDENTPKGRDNVNWMLSGIEAAGKLAEAVQKKSSETKSDTEATKDANKSYDDSIEKLRKAGYAAGFSKDQVDALIAAHARVKPVVQTIFNTPGIDPAIADTKEFLDYVKGLPKKKQVAVHAPGAAGAAALLKTVRDYLAEVERKRRALARARAIRIQIRIDETTYHNDIYAGEHGAGARGSHPQQDGNWGDAWNNVGNNNLSGLPGNAAGGYITGPGGPTSDSIPSWLSNGEYVVNAAATAANRTLLEAINRGGMARGDMARGTPNGYASGGMAHRSGAALTLEQHVTVANLDELQRKTQNSMRDVITMANLRGI